MPRLLDVEDLIAGYGESVVIDGVSFTLDEGESLALLGRNGAGKTTLVTTLMGLTRRRGGTISLRGRRIEALPPFERAHAGLGWVPQERFVFPSLTVHEHLTSVARAGPWTAEKVYELFPSLAGRRGNYGNQLSGGEQQMLAIARALVVNPSLLLLDEPLEGLAPLVARDLTAVIRRLVAESGMAVILVEQHARLALGLTTSALVLERGRVAHRSSSRELLEDPERLARLASVA